MVDLQKPIAARLKQLRIHIDHPDEATAILRNVPTHPGAFSKTHTNLLVKRAPPSAVLVLGVDEDLEYRGEDADLVKAFAGGVRRQGWRLLVVNEQAARDAPTLVDFALRLLGADGQPPALPKLTPSRPAATPLIALHGRDLSEAAARGECEISIGREEAVIELLSATLRWSQARMPILLGESGVGKTNLLHGAALQLRESRPALRLVVVDLSTLLSGTLFDAERENLLSNLFKEVLAARETIVALEHVELCLIGYGPLQLMQALDAGAKLIGLTLTGHLPRFQIHPILRRFHFIELQELDADATLSVLKAVQAPLAAHHTLEIDPQCLRGCVHWADELPGCLPAKAIALLDAAASRAALSGAKVLALDDVMSAAEAFRRRLE
jgi:ATP-dependent Clp protease ATP-binding subunit ClpA